MALQHMNLRSTPILCSELHKWMEKMLECTILWMKHFKTLFQLGNKVASERRECGQRERIAKWTPTFTSHVTSMTSCSAKSPSKEAGDRTPGRRP